MGYKGIITEISKQTDTARAKLINKDDYVTKLLPIATNMERTLKVGDKVVVIMFDNTEGAIVCKVGDDSW